MGSRALALVLLLAGSAEIAAQGVPGISHVSIRATGPVISVTGGAEEVSATLHGRGGAALDGLVIERAGRRISILLAAAIETGARIEALVPTSTNLRVEGSNGGAVIVRGV